MWKSRRVDLKLRLALRVAALAASCFAGASVYALIETDRAAGTKAAEVAEVAARALALQHAQLAWVSPAPNPFPDVPRLAAAFTAPGLCIAYRTGNREILQRVCNGPQSGESDIPKPFERFYSSLFDPGQEVARPLDLRDAALGEVVVSVNPESVVAQAWRDTSGLLAVMAVTLLGLCLLIYAAIARALRPTRVILAGLERLAANDLSARMPDFDLAELSRIGEVFNHLAASLDRTLAERNELTRRLIAVQDEERQHLARELHDEFGQCLAAIAAVAASASQTARDECPALLLECRTIQRTAAQMMDTLRGALVRLRAPDIDELGLALSVEGLVAGWNIRSRGATHYELELSGRFHALPSGLAANIYRIAQEALTNAAKHAEATRVQLRLLRRGAALDAADRPAGEIELIVEDDGKTGDIDIAGKAGMGLLGMRERIAALGGRLSFEAGQPTGLILRAVIPAPPIALEAGPG
jgi:signal transduction histidine kinase